MKWKRSRKAKDQAAQEAEKQRGAKYSEKPGGGESRSEGESVDFTSSHTTNFLKCTTELGYSSNSSCSEDEVTRKEVKTSPALWTTFCSLNFREQTRVSQKKKKNLSFQKVSRRLHSSVMLGPSSCLVCSPVLKKKYRGFVKSSTNDTKTTQWLLQTQITLNKRLKQIKRGRRGLAGHFVEDYIVPS